MWNYAKFWLQTKETHWLLGSTSPFFGGINTGLVECTMWSSHRDSACRPPTVAPRSSLTLARLQNDVSRVNEDRDVVVGRAVCRQEALDCLHLLQNSDETKHINISYQSVSHHEVIKVCTCAWTPPLCSFGRVTVKGRLHQLANSFYSSQYHQYNTMKVAFLPSVFPDPSFLGRFIVKIYYKETQDHPQSFPITILIGPFFKILTYHYKTAEKAK